MSLAVLIVAIISLIFGVVAIVNQGSSPFVLAPSLAGAMFGILGLRRP